MTARHLKRIRGLVETAGFSGVVLASQARQLVSEEFVPPPQLLLGFLPFAQRRARAALSSFKVGAVVESEGGNLYFGANIELPEVGIGFGIHAEQVAIANAWSHGERRVISIAASAMPCGFCRQFLYELTGAEDIAVVCEGQPSYRLSGLLPAPFGERRLRTKANAFSVVKDRLRLAKKDETPLARSALAAAMNSYAPVTHAPSGVALETAAGKVYTGAYLECMTLNPSVTPMLGAIAHLIGAGGDLNGITSAVLVEVKGARISHYGATQSVLAAIAPRANLKVCFAKSLD